MMIKKKDMSEVAREVLTEYRKLGSLRAVASTLKISGGKVRKILITEKIVEYERTKQALILLKYGKTLSEVAYSLGISEKVLNNYLPYTKGEYMGDNPSENALKIRACRKRAQQDKEI